MKCNNCDNEIKESENVCSSCGSPVNGDIQNNVVNNQELKKNNNAILAIIVFIVVVVCGIGIFVFLSQKEDEQMKEKTSEKPTEKTTENYGDNQMGKTEASVKIIKEDKDYKAYELAISNFNGEGKYDFKLSSHVITLDFDAFDDETEYKVYVDGNYIFDDSVIAVGDNGFLIDVHTLGDYVLLQNHWVTDVKGSFLNIVDKSGRLVKKIYNFDDSYTLFDFIPEDSFDSSGITVVANRRDEDSKYVCTNYKEESCVPVSLCDKAEWPKELTEKSLYSVKYKFEYANGVLDLKGKLIESKTIEEFIESFDGLLCSSEE